MKLILCVDKNRGMMFNRRRQSQDRFLRERILQFTAGSKLWMSVYSAKQFSGGETFIADDNYASKAAEEDFCFVEDGVLPMERCRYLVLYHWNRKYQADRFFEHDLKAEGFQRISKADFSGHSHEKITEEIYVKNRGNNDE